MRGQQHQQPPHQESLSIETVSDLADGQSAAVINAAIGAAVRDTEDRGDDGKERKVTITIGLKKLGSESVSATVKAKTTIPEYATKPTIGRLVASGRHATMRFSPAAADNPDQPALPATDEEAA